MEALHLPQRVHGRWFLVDGRGEKTPLTHAELRELVDAINAEPDAHKVAGSVASGVFHYTAPGNKKEFTVVRKGSGKGGKKS